MVLQGGFDPGYELKSEGFHNHNHQDWVMIYRPISVILNMVPAFSGDI
jgi:hypothetical protein